MTLRKPIKNSHIKHMTVYPVIRGIPQKDSLLYLCNQACSVTPEKVARTKEEVTCKRCIQILEKKGE
jgi:hypothetical protein